MALIRSSRTARIPVRLILTSGFLEPTRKALGDISGLAKSIDKTGQLQPIILDEGHNLLAGQRRFCAVKSLGHEYVEALIVSFDQNATMQERLLYARIIEREENAQRKPLTPSEKVAIADAIEASERVAAKARQEASRAKPGQKVGEAKKGAAKLAGPSGRVRDIAAKAVGTSPETLRKAKAVVSAAESNPTRFGPVAEEMDRTGKVDLAYKVVTLHRVRPEDSKAGAQARALELLDELEGLLPAMRLAGRGKPHLKALREMVEEV